MHKAPVDYMAFTVVWTLQSFVRESALLENLLHGSEVQSP